MKYGITFHCHHQRIFHLGNRGVNAPAHYKGPGDRLGEQPKFVRALFNINGVATVTVSPYKFEVEKAELYEWPELIPQIVFEIQFHIARGSQLEQCLGLNDREEIPLALEPDNIRLANNLEERELDYANDFQRGNF